MTRWKASFIHLLISFLVVSSIAAYIITFWYPPALMRMAKADKLLMLVGGIDLIIGPMLTLLVFRQGKPTLRMDLTVIALLQAGFMAFGLYAAFVSRPVFMVASPRIFDLVFATDMDPELLAKGKEPQYRTLGVAKPLLVGAMIPTNAKESSDLMESISSGRGDLQYMPQFYVEYRQVALKLLANARPLKADNGVSAEAAAALQEAARGYGRQPEELRFMPLRSSRGFAAMLLDGKTGEVVGPADVDP